MDLNELNHIGQIDLKKPTQTIKDLNLGVQYKIYTCKRVTTRYGDTILLELDACEIFLPKRFAEITDDQVTAFNTGKYTVEYRGLVGNSISVKFSEKQSMDLNELNHIGQIDLKKPTRTIKDLNLGVQYKIYTCKRVTTRYGDTVLLELDACEIFLPKRFAEITDDQVTAFNTGNYAVEYKGLVGNTTSVKFSEVNME